MAITDLFAGEIATELLKVLFSITRKSCLCKSTAEQLIASVNELLPIIQEIKYSGVELTALRQSQLDRLSEKLRDGLELAQKVETSSRWNVYKNLQLARKMEKLEKSVSRFLKGPLQAHLLADVHHIRFETAERFDRLDNSARQLEQRLGAMKIGVDGGRWLEEAVRRVEEEERWCEGNMVNLGVGMALGKKKLKDILIKRDDLGVVGLSGIGGSGKTTLARDICRDEEVRSHFNERILFLTVSQSPNVEQLKVKIWGHLSGHCLVGCNDLIPEWKLQTVMRIQTRKLVILDDVWSISVLEQLIFRVPGCKILVVSRFKFPTVIQLTHELELLREDEAVSLLCYFAFGQKSIPHGANEKLVKQVVNECKGLPLALKVIGASLRGQPEMFWASAKNRLLRGEPICESHEVKLLERMAVSINYLAEKVKECFLDLGSFPEDKKIPLDVLINMWVELHDIDGEEAFAILVELSDKSLLTLVKDARAGDMYSSYFEISVSQHDVLRDLALHLSNQGSINERRRLLMARRENGLPKEWERHMDQPFNARIVSVHTGEMKERDWFHMEFPKAEVLILNFSSGEYFLPPFIDSMPKLRALILINCNSSVATLHNFSALANLGNLRSLWFEKISLPHLSDAVALKKLRKVSLILCKVNDILDQSTVDLPQLYPCLSELTMDHCEDVTELASSICSLRTLKLLSITNCSLHKLPADLSKLNYLEILRIYACPALRTLPRGIGELVWLKYLDISQCVSLQCLPESIGGLIRLEKLDMRECRLIRNLPKSIESLQSLRLVICDEEVSWVWRDVEMVIPDLHVQVAEECFNLDWLSE